MKTSEIIDKKIEEAKVKIKEIQELCFPNYSLHLMEKWQKVITKLHEWRSRITKGL